MPKARKPAPEVHPWVGAQKKQKARRVCLHCQKTFISRGPGNRICSRCKRVLGDARLPLRYRSELRHEPE